MKGGNNNASFDRLTLIFFGLMVLTGWLNIYAAVYDASAQHAIWDLSLNSGRQLLFIGLSLLIIGAVRLIDVHVFENLAYLGYLAVMLLLLLVPVIGKEVGGNKAWIGIGSFGIQPSEFAKAATALALARYIGSGSFKSETLKSQFMLLALAGIPFGLVMLQKDTGTALVFTSFLLVLFREGMSPLPIVIGLCVGIVSLLTITIQWGYLFGALGVIWVIIFFVSKYQFKTILRTSVIMLSVVGVMLSTDYVMNNVLKPHQRSRIYSLVNPSADPLGVGWNVTQSKIAIGSGGFFGKGYLEGTQTKFDFVPEQSTDFIFCTIGEEHGWIGSLFVIGLFLLFFIRLMVLAERQKTRFARSFGYGIIAVFFFHFTINIGMTVGLAPVIGIPLPFFSYGGSSLLGFTFFLFIFLKLDAHRGQVLQRL